MNKGIYKLAACLTAFGVLSSCDKLDKVLPVSPQDPANLFVTYIIPQNNHSTSNNIGLVKGNKLIFKAIFDQSAVYTTADKANQADINKLYGFSDCNSAHHTNSARFGWRWYNNRLEIFAYTYQNGKRYDKFITAVALNKEYQYEMEAVETKYVFKLDGKTIEMDRGCSGNPDKYKLFPYFGGDEVAPHEIKIQIEEMK